MSQRVYAQLMTIYHPLEIQSAEFNSKKEWVEFFRKHKYECYPLSLYLYDPLFDIKHTPFTYQFIGQRKVILRKLVELPRQSVDGNTLFDLERINTGLKNSIVTHIKGKLTIEARTILSRLDFTIVENGAYTYVIDTSPSV